MPTYSYRCKSCAHEIEEFQKISDPPLVSCPKCKKNDLVRIIGGGAGLVFKGSGFYLTDYKRSSSTPPDGKAAASKKSHEKESKSESKGESKTDSSGEGKATASSAESKSSSE